MSFLYERLISISRPDVDLDVGAQSYSGVSIDTETLLFENIPATVQASSGSSRPSTAEMPAAAPAPIQWKILIPRGKIANGAIQTKDIITDDLGRRFQVSADYCHSMGWTLMTIKLEAY